MMRKAYETPDIPCPYCSAICSADFVDNGIGMQQCGPYHCDECFASEIGPFDKERRLTDIEKNIGWYAPHSEPGSSANVIGGKIVSHKIMERIYRDNYPASGGADWWDTIRKSTLDGDQ